MDAGFFKGFAADLHNKYAWKEYCLGFRNGKKKLKDKVNPTQLGDHVSLKAEAAESSPTDQDRGAQVPQSSRRKEQAVEHSGNSGRPSLSKLAKDTTIGDPVSLEAEEVVDSSEDKANAHPAALPSKTSTSIPADKENDPPMPTIDGESLFWAMMAASRHPDPYVFPALERLSKAKSRPVIAALSNTVIFPPDHPYSKQERISAPNTPASNAFFFNPRTYFDVYVASAEVGMRKPSRDIYEYALQRLDEYDRRNGGQGIEPGDVVFLDDIGENLKMGREVGMRTIRVQLGKTWRAVKELEGVLGMELMDEKTRRSKL